MMVRLLRVAIVVACGCLALGYAWGGNWPGAASSLGLGILWLVLRSPRRPWLPTPAFAGCVALAAAGTWLRLGAGWMLLAVVAALCAWDLEGLDRRLERLAPAGARPALERRHLRRLGPVASLGLLLGLAALVVELRLEFWPALLLGLLAIAGLSWITYLLRTEA